MATPVRRRESHRAARGSNAPWTASVRRPWWKRALGLLRFKLMRRLLYVVLVLLLLNAALDYYFGGNDSDNAGGGTVSPARQEQRQAALRSKTPSQAIIRFYDLLAAYQPPGSGFSPTDPGRACLLLTPGARSAFAEQHTASDCRSAAQKLNRERITVPRAYTSPDIPENAVVINEAIGDAKVRSCQLVVTGGPRLGNFGLKKSNGTWVIDGYEPADCNR